MEDKNKQENLIKENERLIKFLKYYLIILVISYGILFGMAIYLKLKGG